MYLLRRQVRGGVLANFKGIQLLTMGHLPYANLIKVTRQVFFDKKFFELFVSGHYLLRNGLFGLLGQALPVGH